MARGSAELLVDTTTLRSMTTDQHPVVDWLSWRKVREREWESDRDRERGGKTNKRREEERDRERERGKARETEREEESKKKDRVRGRESERDWYRVKERQIESKSQIQTQTEVGWKRLKDRKRVGRFASGGTVQAAYSGLPQLAISSDERHFARCNETGLPIIFHRGWCEGHLQWRERQHPPDQGHPGTWTLLLGLQRLQGLKRTTSLPNPLNLTPVLHTTKTFGSDLVLNWSQSQETVALYCGRQLMTKNFLSVF